MEYATSIKNSLLRAIVEQMKNFYEYPVLLVTKKDYSDNVFNTMCGVHRTIRDQEPIKYMESIVHEFHNAWLETVAELFAFSDKLESVSQDDMQEIVTYTKRAAENRLKYFIRYVETYRSNLCNDEQFKLRVNLEIIHDMHADFLQHMETKMICYQAFTGLKEFQVKVKLDVEELFDFVDIIYDKLASDVSKLYCYELYKTILQDFQRNAIKFDQKAHHKLADDKPYEAMLEKLFVNCETHQREMLKLDEKRKALSVQLLQLNNDTNTPLKHIIVETKKYVEKRLQYLQNSKTTIEEQNYAAMTALKFNTGFHLIPCKIFIHSLPPHERKRLVDKLYKSWIMFINSSEQQFKLKD